MFNFGYKKRDVLAIGDISVDNFIKVNDAKLECDPDHDHCELCLRYGGKIPYDQSEVCYATGNSSNVAIALRRLGLKTILMSNVGNDENGRKCLSKLKDEKVDISFINKNKDLPTNYHYILWYGVERTILTKHEKYDYKWTNTRKSHRYHPPSFIYLSSLGENSLEFHQDIINYLKRHIKVKLIFQPGTFQIKLGQDKLSEIYQRTEIFLSNKDEAQRILKTENDDINELLKMIKELGPKIVVITNGENGAYAYDGENVHFVESLSQEKIESTGAGDAFSGAFVYAYILGKDINESLIWGAINARSVIGHIGPHKGLLTRRELEEKVEDLKINYKLNKIN